MFRLHSKFTLWVKLELIISNKEIKTLTQAQVELEADLLEEFNKTSECEWEKVGQFNNQYPTSE